MPLSPYSVPLSWGTWLSNRHHHETCRGFESPLRYQLLRSARRRRNTSFGVGSSGRSGKAWRSLAITVGLCRRKKALISFSSPRVVTTPPCGSWSFTSSSGLSGCGSRAPIRFAKRRCDQPGRKTRGSRTRFMRPWGRSTSATSGGRGGADGHSHRLPAAPTLAW